MSNKNINKAIILLSGGLDSTTVLAIAKKHNYNCYAISFNYGQKQKSELNAAKKIAKQYQVIEHKIINIPTLQGSALTDNNIAVPKYQNSDSIPITYVPARNTVFLSLALAFAELIACQDIFIGVNNIDYSGYPDCRPEYIDAFTKMANLATKQAILGNKTTIHTPLINLQKVDIIKLGLSLGVDYTQTVSCYQADENGRACGLCDACIFRAQGFAKLNQKDPTKYKNYP